MTLDASSPITLPAGIYKDEKAGAEVAMHDANTPLFTVTLKDNTNWKVTYWKNRKYWS